MAKRKGKQLSLAILDIDGLKEINDRYGHLAGDEVLREVGKKLRENVRASDIIARYGGDEFALILPETSSEEAKAVLQRLTGILEKSYFLFKDKPITLPHFSYVIATYPQDGEEDKQLFEVADQCLYLSQKEGLSPEPFPLF